MNNSENRDADISELIDSVTEQSDKILDRALEARKVERAKEYVTRGINKTGKILTDPKTVCGFIAAGVAFASGVDSSDIHLSFDSYDELIDGLLATKDAVLGKIRDSGLILEGASTTTPTHEDIVKSNTNSKELIKWFVIGGALRAAGGSIKAAAKIALDSLATTKIDTSKHDDGVNLFEVNTVLSHLGMDIESGGNVVSRSDIVDKVKAKIASADTLDYHQLYALDYLTRTDPDFQDYVDLLEKTVAVSEVSHSKQNKAVLKNIDAISRVFGLVVEKAVSKRGLVPFSTDNFFQTHLDAIIPKVGAAVGEVIDKETKFGSDVDKHGVLLFSTELSRKIEAYCQSAGLMTKSGYKFKSEDGTIRQNVAKAFKAKFLVDLINDNQQGLSLMHSIVEKTCVEMDDYEQRNDSILRRFMDNVLPVNRTFDVSEHTISNQELIIDAMAFRVAGKDFEVDFDDAEHIDNIYRIVAAINDGDTSLAESIIGKVAENNEAVQRRLNVRQTMASSPQI